MIDLDQEPDEEDHSKIAFDTPVGDSESIQERDHSPRSGGRTPSSVNSIRSEKEDAGPDSQLSSTSIRQRSALATINSGQPLAGHASSYQDRISQIVGHVSGVLTDTDLEDDSLRGKAQKAAKASAAMALSMLKELVLDKPIHYPIISLLGLLRVLPRFLSGYVSNRSVFNIAALLAVYKLWKRLISEMEVHRMITGKVDHSSPLHGGHLAAHVLLAHKVDALFTLAGGHVSPVLVAAEEMGVRVIDVRDEATAVFAADGYARLTGRIGVAVVTAGPGLTNTVTAVKNAQMAESPVLVISGAAATLLKGRGALQDIDQLALMKPICKSTHTVSRVRSIPSTLLIAINHALTAPMGPVYVELPIDTLYPVALVAKNVGAGSQGKGGPLAALVDSVLAAYVRYVFADAFEGFGYREGTVKGNSPLVATHTIRPLPIPRPPLPSRPLSRAVATLILSHRPVLLLGSQSVSRGPEAAARLAAAVKGLGVPIFLAGMARGLVGQDGGGVQLRQVRKKALATADVIVLAGITPDFRLDYGRTLSRRAKIITCNSNPAHLHLNAGLFWNPEVTCLGDPGEFIEALCKGVENERTVKGKGWELDKEWVKGLAELEKNKEDEIRSKSLLPVPQSSCLNPLWALSTLEAHLPTSTILIADGGDFVGTAAYILRPRGPLTWMDPGAFGTLGCGAGFAIAAKVCMPESQVWVVYGDGSFGWSMAEVDTWVRHKLGIVAIIGNDAKWAQIAREQVTMLGSPTACLLSRTADYAAAGRAMGGRGWTVKAPQQLEKALEDAVAAAGNGVCGVIDVWIGETDFREGSVSV
ncbi:hypothetical protein HDU93_008377 [Gonapodya sp. JEL0774]|nr:hypothetical protein HDU93_008377 [Gonapodya sp. JEL0774]